MIDRREFISGAGAALLTVAGAAARPIGPHGVAALSNGVRALVNWILRAGAWNDALAWNDAQAWKDS
jgi:hypothetical protein